MTDLLETRAMPKLQGACSKCGRETAYPIAAGTKTSLCGDCWTEKRNNGIVDHPDAKIERRPELIRRPQHVASAFAEKPSDAIA